MKFVRFGSLGQERPGIVDSSGTIRDLGGVIGDLTPDAISDEALAGLRALDLARLPAIGGTVRLGCPLAASGSSSRSA